jgi:hypothetical protein
MRLPIEKPKRLGYTIYINQRDANRSDEMENRLEKLIEKKGQGYINGKSGKERVSIRVNNVLEIEGKMFAAVYFSGFGYRTTVWYDGVEVYDTEYDIKNNRPYVTKTLRNFEKIVDACLK